MAKFDNHHSGHSPIPQISPFHEFQMAESQTSNEGEIMSDRWCTSRRLIWKMSKLLLNEEKTDRTTFLRWSQSDHTTMIKKDIVSIRQSYEEHPTNMYSDNKLARIMLLDACFIITYIEARITPIGKSKQVLKLYENYSSMTHHLSMLTISIMFRDMPLLENQIPFWILKLLINSRYNKDEGQELLNRSLNMTIFGELPQKRSSLPENKEDALHLHEAFHRVFFLNMIAYELSPSSTSIAEVISCVSFMKSLIETPEDVKELQENKILFNTLGSDEQVLNVYKEIDTYNADNESIYQDGKDKIQAHCNSKAKTWMAELIHSYFHSP
ncbi:hypothetical protein CDL12_01656 [Handroanthus impetiginosus]|uniref:Uncharacterized protein n=1 Tax=Handroanthus impetiginosus TaxID=429701 RepID=A0A2G9I784_9LAMI|nr:hypothetical protein CDL12_01656 [Handroanthus impetiginosus]